MAQLEHTSTEMAGLQGECRDKLHGMVLSGSAEESLQRLSMESHQGEHGGKGTASGQDESLVQEGKSGVGEALRD